MFVCLCLWGWCCVSVLPVALFTVCFVDKILIHTGMVLLVGLLFLDNFSRKIIILFSIPKENLDEFSFLT